MRPVGENGTGGGESRPSPDAAEELEASMDFEDLGKTDCPEGCTVEPDGTCPHGYLSAGLTGGWV
jgi:hypothetical protein